MLFAVHTPPGVCGALLLGQPRWVWVSITIAVAAAVLLAYFYRRSGWPSRLSWIAGGLKAAGVALLALCLLEPLWSGTRAQPGENLVLLVADASRSLTIEDGPAGAPRSEQFTAVLGDAQQTWQVRLGQDFRVRRYTVDSAPHAVQTFEGQAWDGPRSALGRSLSSLAERYREQPVAAVLLFTDGIATDEFDPQAFRGGPPIYPVLPATPTEIRDVSIEQTAVTQSSFEDAPVTIQADVVASAAITEPLVVRLLDGEGGVVAEQKQPPGETGRATPFRFQTRPKQPLSFYRIDARAESDANAFAAEPQSAEATLANNVRMVAVERDPGPYRVLYVSGRPNWEFKFLRRAVNEDPDVQLVGLIRMAKREAKFEFLGREGESTNPLFRGFKKDWDEETESYDQPVLIALGVKDERELTDAGAATVQARFPRTAEELFAYHAVILDDVEAAFFSHEQQALLERFVAQRGGGLLMLGGPQSFHHGEWHKTVVKDVLPVYCDRAVPAGDPNLLADPPPEFQLQLTRDGWLQPWVRLRQNEADERKRLGEMSGFQVVSRINGVKPAAQVLASVVDNQGDPRPALVAQTYGDGRGAALLIGDLWRWSMRRPPGAEDDLGKAWRQAVRWLVTDVPQRIEADYAWTTAGDADALTLRVRVRDKQFEPQENAAASVTIAIPGEPPLTLQVEPSLEQPGEFLATFVPRLSGSYTADFTVIDADGAALGTAQIGWTYQPEAEEFRRLAVHREAMQQLAEASGGEVLTPADLQRFAESLPERDVPIQAATTTPLWHSPWMLTLILLLLAGEWGLRRWKGLP